MVKVLLCCNGMIVPYSHTVEISGFLSEKRLSFHYVVGQAQLE